MTKQFAPTFSCDTLHNSNCEHTFMLDETKVASARDGDEARVGNTKLGTEFILYLPVSSFPFGTKVALFAHNKFDGLNAAS